MTRLDRRLLPRLQTHPLLVPFVVAGDPDLTQSARILDALAQGGADLVELGVPYSDPSADGPVIQRASERALAAGARFDDVLALVRGFRARHDTPLILFGYVNTFFRRGFERVVREASDAGVDGFLVVDLPPEEAGELRALCVASGLDLVPTATPVSPPARLRRIGESATSVVYAVSMTGVTGAQLRDYAAIEADVARVRAETGRPVLLGFGVATPQDAGAIAGFAEGVVVGSALVRAIDEAPEFEKADTARRFVASFRAQMDAR